MDDYTCPTPEPFCDNIGFTIFLSWLFYLTFVSRIIVAPLMPSMAPELGLSPAEAGSFFFLMAAGYLLAPVLTGILSSRFNHRGALTLSNIAVGAALLFFASISSYFAALAAMFVLGLAAGLHIPSAMATITAQIRKPDWGKAIGMHQSAPPFSFVSAPIIVALLSGYLSWRHIVLIIGIASIISGIGNQAFSKAGLFPGQMLNFKIAKEVLKRGSFWIMVALFAMGMSGTAGIFSMLPLYLVKERAMSANLANTVVGLAQVSGLVMVFFAGWITDKAGMKQTIRGALLGAGALTILIGTLSGTWLLVAIFIQPALITSFFPGAFAAVSRIVPPRQRSISNALAPSLAFLIGGGIIPVFIGSLAEVRSFALGITITGCFILIGPILIRYLKLGQFDDEDGC